MELVLLPKCELTTAQYMKSFRIQLSATGLNHPRYQHKSKLNKLQQNHSANKVSPDNKTTDGKT